MICANPECGKPFESTKSSHRYCCKHCQERALYLRKVADGRAAAEVEAKRLRRAMANGGKRKSKKNRRMTIAERERMLECQMSQSPEELREYSAKWTKEDHKIAKKIYMRKHRLFPSFYA